MCNSARIIPFGPGAKRLVQSVAFLAKGGLAVNRNRAKNAWRQSWEAARKSRAGVSPRKLVWLMGALRFPVNGSDGLTAGAVMPRRCRVESGRVPSASHEPAKRPSSQGRRESGFAYLAYFAVPSPFSVGMVLEPFHFSRSRFAFSFVGRGFFGTAPTSGLVHRPSPILHPRLVFTPLKIETERWERVREQMDTDHADALKRRREIRPQSSASRPSLAHARALQCRGFLSAAFTQGKAARTTAPLRPENQTPKLVWPHGSLPNRHLPALRRAPGRVALFQSRLVVAATGPTGPLRLGHPSRSRTAGAAVYRPGYGPFGYHSPLRPQSRPTKGLESSNL